MPKKPQIVICMKLDQKPNGTATLKVGPKFLQTQSRPPATDTYDTVLSMAISIKTLLIDLGFSVMAEDRFTARVLGIDYFSQPPFFSKVA